MDYIFLLSVLIIKCVEKCVPCESMFNNITRLFQMISVEVDKGLDSVGLDLAIMLHDSSLDGDISCN